jgi:hypothetical protein
MNEKTVRASAPKRALDESAPKTLGIRSGIRAGVTAPTRDALAPSGWADGTTGK